MAIKIEYEQEFLKEINQEIKKQSELFQGYRSDKEIDIYKQMEAIYDLLKEIEVIGADEDGNQEFDGVMCQKNLLQTDIVFDFSLIRFIIENMAVLALVSMHEIGLNPILIVSESDIAIGVWVNGKMDMEVSRIQDEEFVEEIETGNVIVFSCSSLIQKKNFNQAKKDGEWTVKQFLVAVDLAKDDTIYQQITSDMDDPEDETELGQLEIEAVNETENEEKLFVNLEEEMSEVRSLYAYLKDEFHDTFGIECEELYQKRLVQAFFKKNSGVSKDELALLLVQKENRDYLVADAVKTEAAQKARVLVLTSEFRDEVMKGNLENVFQKRMLTLNTTDTYTVVRQIRSNYQETIVPIDVKDKSNLKRYKEIKALLDEYEHMQTHPTPCGVSLKELAEYVEQNKSKKIEDTIPPFPLKETQISEEVWGPNALLIVKQYIDAGKKIQIINPADDSIKAPFGRDIRWMNKFCNKLKDCGAALRAFFKASAVLGDQYAIGVRKDTKPTAENYLEAIRLMIKMLEMAEGIRLYQNAYEKARYERLPKYISDENKTALKKYREYKKSLDFVENNIQHPKALMKLENIWDHEVYKLAEKIAANRVSPKSSDIPEEMEKAIRSFIDTLEACGIAEKEQLYKKIFKISTAKPKLDRVNTYAEGIVKYVKNCCPRNIVYEKMAEIWEEHINDEPYLFVLQKKLAEKYIGLLQYQYEELLDPIVTDMISELLSRMEEEELLEEQTKEFYQHITGAAAAYEKYREAEKAFFDFADVVIEKKEEADSEKTEKPLPELIEKWFGDSKKRRVGSTSTDKMPLEYIQKWYRLYITEGKERPYEDFLYHRTQMNKYGYASLLYWIEHSGLAVDRIYPAFERIWYEHNLEVYKRSGEEKPDGISSYNDLMKKYESLKKKRNAILLKAAQNNLINRQQKICKKYGIQSLEDLDVILNDMKDMIYLKEAYKKYGDLLQEFFPIVVATPESALREWKDDQINFDKIIVYDSDAIAFYKILYLLSFTQKLEIYSLRNENLYVNERTAVSDKVDERAFKMGFQAQKMREDEED